MTLSRRKFSAECKLRALRQVEAGASVAAVARRYEIHPTLLSKWRQQLRRHPERAFQRDREPNDEQVRVSGAGRVARQGPLRWVIAVGSTSTLPHHLVVIDCETTGLGSNDRIIEIAVTGHSPTPARPRPWPERYLPTPRPTSARQRLGTRSSMVLATPAARW